MVVLPPTTVIGGAVEEAVTAEAGCVIVALAVAVHPFASVTVTLYVPAGRPLRSSVVAPFDHI